MIYYNHNREQRNKYNQYNPDWIGPSYDRRSYQPSQIQEQLGHVAR